MTTPTFDHIALTVPDLAGLVEFPSPEFRTSMEQVALSIAFPREAPTHA